MGPIFESVIWDGQLIHVGQWLNTDGMHTAMLEVAVIKMVILGPRRLRWKNLTSVNASCQFRFDTSYMSGSYFLAPCEAAAVFCLHVVITSGMIESDGIPGANREELVMHIVLIAVQLCFVLGSAFLTGW